MSVTVVAQVALGSLGHDFGQAGPQERVAASAAGPVWDMHGCCSHALGPAASFLSRSRDRHQLGRR